MGHRILIKWQTKPLNHLQSSIANYLSFASINIVNNSIKVFELELKPSERLKKTDLLPHTQICTSPPILVMQFHCNRNHHITSIRINRFITLTLKNNLTTIIGSLLNDHIQRFIFLHNTITLANSTLPRRTKLHPNAITNPTYMIFFFFSDYV